MRRLLALVLVGLMVIPLAACSGQDEGSSAGVPEAITDLPTIDMAAWKYNEDDDVYYQTGIQYCSAPADEAYETLAVFVPGAYMEGHNNGDGTYTCELSAEGKVKGYTTADAPIVMPVNTPGYSAQAALTDYTDVTDYTKAGFVYVHAGCRGRDAGAPAGVTDLKAAIRYIRYCENVLPGSAERIFAFGMSGGGAQTAVLGSTGDSDLYTAYLDQIGAVQGVSDSIFGVMCWCPITNLDTADAAYEWMMGPTRTGLTEEEQNISNHLAVAFGSYINAAKIKDPDGKELTLDLSETGIFQTGTYYEYMKSVIEKSLNNFLKDTEFPYEVKASGKGGPGGLGGGMPGGDRPDGAPEGGIPEGGAPGEGAQAGEPPAGELPDGEQSIEETDNITRTSTTNTRSITLSGTYETAQDYIDALNANGEWVSYNADKNKAKITSITDFALALKNASKGIGAFDQLDAGQGENVLFGYGDGKGAHFDVYIAEIVNSLGSSCAGSYLTDISKTDSANNTVDVRVNMYTPLYYLLETQEGYKTSTVAKYWRIRSGINQSDCALSTEMNLALALQNYEGVESVNFATVWGQGHTMAERSGDSTSNFIKWINKSIKAANEQE